MVYIVGIGPGNRKYILPEAMEIIQSCDIVVGFSRAIDSIGDVNTGKIKVQKLSEIIDLITREKSRDIAIAASGDPGFYGILDYIKRNYGDSLKVIPGISSFQYMMSSIGLSWQGAYLGSVHGREEDFINVVKNNKRCIFLTDNKNSPEVLADKLYRENINCCIWVGENLSYEDERIRKGTPEEMRNMEFSGLSVFVVEEL